MSALNSKSRRPYTFEEEVWSCAIHGLGIVLSIAGLTTLVALAARYRDVWTVVSTAVFGVSMIVLYTASTIYHAVPNLDLKRHLKKFDHISIYYLIAGSYRRFAGLHAGNARLDHYRHYLGVVLTGTILKLLSSGSGTKVCLSAFI
ncbi:MAG: PAQR family membrane homeostasis protein TrhA [Alphaproteobacteria bacterium]